MFKNITIANSLVSNESVKNLSVEEDHRVDLFRDINNTAYVMLHGMEYTILGTVYGYVDYYGNLIYADELYNNLVETGFIKNGEVLHLICCFGAGVRECQESRVREGFAEDKPIVYENNSHTVCWTLLDQCNGMLTIADDDEHAKIIEYSLRELLS